MSDDRLLGIYLNDHLGAAVAGRERCRYAHEQNAGTELGAFLGGLLREVEEDAVTLNRVLERVGVERSPFKLALGVVGERAGRLKLNGQLTGYSPLSRVLDLEALSVGVEGKQRLWRSLGAVGDPRLAEFDFAALEQRAARQRDGIEEHRVAAARTAFSG